jgi:hypothetical protein
VAEATVLRSQPVDVAGRLDELGLKESVLKDAVKWGCGFVLDCTLNDPAQLPGILGWGKITRALRDSFVPLGWKVATHRSQALTVSADKSVAILVAGGDTLTGTASEISPTTRSAKGPATKDAIAENQRSFAEVSPEFAELEPTNTRTWVLLYCIDEEADEIRVELSFPRYIADNGYVSTWSERVLLSPIPLEGRTPPDGGEEIHEEQEEISVTRRAR